MKTQIFKKTLIALLSLLFLATLSIALFRVIPAHAEPLSIAISVVADADGAYNGSVTSGGQSTSDDNGHKITVEVQSDGSLEVSATAAENYLFQCWATDTAGQTTAVSIKSADTFTYEECQNFAATGLYAIFVPELPEEYAEAQKLKINYNSELGDVYMFFGKPAPTNDDLVSHGVQVKADSEYIIPYTTDTRSARVTRYISYNFLLAAIPKSEVVSKLNGENTTARFMGWKAVYQKVEGISNGNPTGSGYYEEPTSLVPYCDRISGSSSGGDGSFTGSANKSEELGAEWFASSLQASKDSVQWYATNRNNMQYWYFKNVKPGYANYLYVKSQSLVAEFEEVAAVPEVTVTPVVDGVEKPAVISKTLQTTVDMPYGGENNSVRVKIAGLPSAEKQDYTVSVQKERNLEDKGYVLDDSVTCEEMGGDYLFTVSDITVNSNIIITRDYGGEYYTEPLTIFVRFKTEKGLKDLIASDSANIEVINDNGEDWYFDPQFNGGGKLSYTSGISYPEEVTDKSKQSISQLHFQVKGSGVFTFEFYLDGLSGFGTSLAAYKFDSAFDKSDFEYDLIPSKSQAKQLAEGNGYLFTGFEYRECEMTEQNGVARLSGNKGWCSATIQVSGKQDEEYTDVYIVHATSDSGCSHSSVSEWYKAHAVMSVRNVAFYQGKSNVSWGIYGNDEEGTKNDYGTITATVNGEAQSEQPYLSDSGTKITFKVAPKETYKFYGWSDGENLLSTELEFTYTVHGKKGDEISQTNIYAVITPADEASTYAYQNGGKFYAEDKLQQALDGITTNPQVFVLKSVEVSGEITVPKGAELILPFNEEGDFYKDGTESTAGTTFSWKNSKYSTPFRTFTFTGTMTLGGTFRIGAVVNYPGQSYSGLTSGAYTQFINNGSVIVKNGGYADVYGLVTGSGSFNVEALGKMAQPFLILDYSGGNNTYALYEQNQTPFNRYAMVNVQCTGGITVQYMGELLGHASLYALGSINTASAPVISYKTGDNDESVRGLITLSPGGSVKIEYKEEEGVISTAANGTQWIGKTTVTFYGAASANHMSLNVGFTISTEDVKAFAVPYNFEIILEEGTFAVDGNFKFMPGSSLTVKHGATLNVNNTLYIYDGLVQSGMSGKTYPTAEQLKKAGYNTNATFIVDGKLNINSTATFLGVVQTNGTGEIVTSSGATLSGTIEEGGLGGYDCNYMEYKTSARIWDSVHGEHGRIAILEAGRTYNGVVCDSWTLPAITLKYDKKNYGGVESSHVDHATSTEFIEASTLPVNGLKGSWKATHDGHNFDWNPSDKDSKPDDSNHIVELTRQCTEIGCTEEEHKNLLYLPESLGDLTYKGAAYTEQEIKAQLFEKYFTGDKVSGFAVNLSELSGSALTQGDYTVKAALTSGYFLQGEQYVTEATLKFKIIPFTITEANVEITQSDLQYTGEDITPTYSVTWNGEGAVTYEASWQNNKNAGENAKLIITANGQFTGVVTVEFKITPKPITVTVKDKETVYTGEAQTYSGGVNVTDYTVGEGLYPSDDLQITLSATGTEAGDYNISGESANTNYTVTFNGEHGKHHGIYKIKPAEVTAVLTQGESYGYTGKKIEPEVTLTWGGEKTLDAGAYNKTFGDNTNVSDDNHVTIGLTSTNFTFNGEDTKKLGFTITAKDIEGAEVKVDGEYTYTGNAIQPEKGNITATIDDLEVTFEDLISYGNNTDVEGGGTVTITGNGNFTGTATGNFVIKAKDITGATVRVNKEYIYTGEDIQPQKENISVSITEWDKDIDFVVSSYKNNRNVSAEAQVTVKGQGNYTGEATGNFEIKPAEVAFSLEKQEYEYTGSQIQPGVNVTWNDGTALDKGRYDLTYGANTNVSDEDISVSIELNDTNFTIAEESKKLTFKITPKDIKDAQVTVNGEYTYTGSAIHPSKDKITATVSGLQVTFAEEIEYGKNADVSGGGTVTITGTNNFQGTATGKFEIKAKDLQGATVTITTPPETIIYKNAQWQPAFTVQVDGISGTLSADSDYDVEYGDNITVADGGKITVKGKGNFTGEVAQTFIIKAKDVTIKVNGGNIEFGKAPEEPYELTITGLLSDVSEEMLKGKLKYSVQSPDSLEAGNKYTVTPSFKDNESLANYSVTFEAGEYTIIVAELSGVKFNGETTVVYNGESHKLEVTGLPAEANGVKVKYNGGESEPIDEGTYTVTAEITFNNGATHTLSGGTLTITAKTVQITVKVHSVIYNGAEQTLNEVYSWQDEDDGILARDRDKVTITLTAKGTEAKSYSITANESGDNAHNYKIEYTGLTNGYVISPKSIEGATVTVSGEYTYTGDEIKPQKSNITVTLAGWNHDITISDTIHYSKNTDASATAQVTVEGNGNYTGNATGTFEIKAKSIEGATVTVNKEYTYTGSAIQPQSGDITVTLKDWSHDITISSEVQYSNNTDAGKAAQVTVEGIGNYTGTATGNFEIKPAEVTFSLEKQEYEYTGEKIQPKVNAVWGGSKTLDSDKYSITYGENTNVADTNNVTVEITDKNFTVSGDIKTKTLAFKIIAKDISKADVKVTGDYTYTGNEIKPQKSNITVTLKDWNLDITISDTVQYSQNTNASQEAKVTVTGSGNYTGEATGTFEIKAKDITGEATIKITTPEAEIVYKNAQWQPNFTVQVDGIASALTNNDYDVTYGENKSAGEGQITIKGKDNYTGEAVKTFTIKQKDVSVTLEPQEAEYNGAEQTVSSASDYWHADGLIEGDDLQVKLTGSQKEVGNTKISVVSVNNNYHLTNTPEAVFTVTAKKINVTIKDQKAVYSNSAPEVSQTEWESDGICNNDNLNIKIEKSAGVTADKYTLTGSYSNPNYLVTFINERGEEQAATFEITKKKVTVTVTPKESVYGDDLAELSYTYDGVIEGDGFNIKNYIEISTDATQYSDVLGSYTISVKLKGEEAQNYAIDCTSTAAYTLTARPVKYTIDNQSSVYNGKVPQVAQKYTLKEGTVVNSDTLGITITAKGLKKDAGKYALTGDWTNKNYAVTFEDGEYEINKLDISENITISVNEENNTDERGNIIAQYSGEPLEVLGMAYSEIEGDEELEIKVTTDVATIEKMGNYTVKATIDDKNYTGEKSFTVIVSDENGYTENIYKVLEELEERTKGINPDDLKEDDFEVLKEARKLIDSLTNDEQEAASEELAEYEHLIAAWNNATTVDEDVIKTAKNIADAPMSALIVVASVSAIAALAYVIGKGGKII